MEQIHMTQKVALIVGAGDALGGAIAKRFARAGFTACVTRRSVEKLAKLKSEIEAAAGVCHAFGSDAREEEEVIKLFAQIEADIGPIEVCVFNIGGNVRFGITEMTARVYRKVWEMCAFGGFLTGREAARVMLPRKKGTIIFTGATASLRGGSGFAAFAGGKHALRALRRAWRANSGRRVFTSAMW
jgi:NAD(P)-dependent dehydrogenase (short-subunit alcohol dehydrogenase family)